MFMYQWKSTSAFFDAKAVPTAQNPKVAMEELM